MCWTLWYFSWVSLIYFTSLSLALLSCVLNRIFQNKDWHFPPPVWSLASPHSIFPGSEWSWWVTEGTISVAAEAYWVSDSNDWPCSTLTDLSRDLDVGSSGSPNNMKYKHNPLPLLNTVLHFFLLQIYNDHAVGKDENRMVDIMHLYNT